MGPNDTRTFYISIAAAIFAAFLLYSYTQEKKAELDKKFGSTKRVVIATRDIAEMETIDDTMLDTVERPEDFIQPGSIVEPDVAVGQVAAAPIKKGEQILQTKLLSPGPDTGIALQVSPGKRAITLPIDEIRAVAKLIKPGDRIDLIGALDVGKGQNTRREVQVLLQDVPVLATGVNVVNNIPRIFEADANGKNIVQTTLTGDTKFTTVTLEVTPKEAQDLIYILSTSPANLFMTLRHPNDRIINRLPSSTIESVLGKPVIDLTEQQRTAPDTRVMPGAQIPQAPPAMMAPPASTKPQEQKSRPTGKFRSL